MRDLYALYEAQFLFTFSFRVCFAIKRLVIPIAIVDSFILALVGINWIVARHDMKPGNGEVHFEQQKAAVYNDSSAITTWWYRWRRGGNWQDENNANAHGSNGRQLARAKSAQT